MARREYKFRLHTAQLTTLRSLLLPHVEPDPYAASCSDHEYTVRSLYFDTASLDFYREKMAGLKVRMKIRIRGYNEISPVAPVYLEIKKKDGTTVTKQRASLPYQNLYLFLRSGGINKVSPPLTGNKQAEENARQFLFYIHSRSLRPVISIAYEREAFYSKHDLGVRVTIDKQLRTHSAISLLSLNRSREDQYALRNRFIFEIKSDGGIPLWLERILSHMASRREATSKYTICVDLLKASGQGFESDPSWTRYNGFPWTEPSD